MTSKWTSATLFVLLEQRSALKVPQSAGAAHAVNKLNLVMPDIEAILAKGGTSPTDFTLHDDDHGRRVANRIGDIAGEVLESLSSAELALLLLSAYLHDIGMTPARDIVNRHRKHLMFGSRAPLSPEETAELQTWLDENAAGVTPPLLIDPTDTEALDRIDLWLTHYCRSRHNDWSEQWIRDHLTTLDRQLYPGYIDDLVQLCRSHHEVYEDLIEARFDPRYVHYAGVIETVHLRYLAALLRIADILEFDPERTPDIVFRHRAVSAGSTIFWHKDHDAIITLDNDVLTFYGQPANAAIFHALRTMADDIDQELDTCWRLDREGRFSLSPLSSDRGPRLWTLTQRLKRAILPRHGSFEVFEGRFRPKTRRLLELLSGTQLYGSNLASIRELLQNAFDAVRERIAYQRLAALDAGLPDDPVSITSSHSVTLCLHTDLSSKWIIDCRDTGMGMNQRILKDRFLAPGTRAGHRERDLERRCSALGFTVGRTGRFGIGAVSYFMLARSIRIITRRSQGAGDDEATAWRFEIDDLEDFGELRRDVAPNVGTVVELLLRQELAHDPSGFFDELCGYLRKTVTRVPCTFSLRFQNEPPAVHWNPGWTLSTTELKERIVHDLAPHMTRGGEPPINRLSSARKQEIADEHASIETLRTELRHKIDIVSEEGELPDALGRYRIHLPFFNLDDGVSLFYIQTRQVGQRTFLKRVLKYSHLKPRRYRAMSWNGIAVKHRAEFPSHFSTEQNEPAPFLEIDWTAADVAELAVSRDKVRLGARAERAIDFLFTRSAGLSQEWVNSHDSSRFAALNSRALRVAPPSSAPIFWTFWSTEHTAYEMREIHFPVIDLDQIGEELPSTTTWRGIEVEGVAAFGERPRSVSSDIVCWSTPFDAPTYVVPWSYEQSSHPFLVGVWASDGSARPYAVLPPQWRTVAAAIVHPRGGRQMAMWNDNHAVALAVTNEAWDWCMKTLDSHGDPGDHHGQILSDRAYASAWLMLVGTRYGAAMWNGLVESNASFINNAWSLAFGDDERANYPLIIARNVGGWLELSVITPSKFEELKYPGDDISRARDILPDPGIEWSLHIEKPELTDDSIPEKISAPKEV